MKSSPIDGIRFASQNWSYHRRIVPFGSILMVSILNENNPAAAGKADADSESRSFALVYRRGCATTNPARGMHIQSLRCAVGSSSSSTTITSFEHCSGNGARNTRSNTWLKVGNSL